MIPTRTRDRLFICCLLLPAALLPAGCRRESAPAGPARHAYDVAIMDTQGRIFADSDTEAQAVAARDAAEARLRTIERLLNRYDAASELSAVNRAAGGPAVPVSESTARAIAAAKRLAQTTGGAFNPLVGSLVALWKRGEADGRLPDENEIRSALGLLNVEDIRLAESGGRWTCRLARPGMRLDLGGLAKGWAAQEALAEMRKCRGIHAALVMLGGDGASWCEPGWPGRWTIGVQDPRRPLVPTVLLRLRTTDAAVVTSGPYYRHYEIAGKRYNHILDPRTGRPTEGSLVSATVIHGDGASADALATACMVLGTEAALELLERTAEAEGLMLEQSGDRLVGRRTAGFARYEVREEDGD